jgi:PD-(D/E)XK nuclease superfamily
MDNSFNIFRVLEKDDKELIHSSFIKFLLLENNDFYLNFLKINNPDFCEPRLEKPYTTPNKKNNGRKERNRIDIEAISKDDKCILIIENKFKSMPCKEQLNSYDEIYNHHHSEKRFYKFIFCFDKELIEFESDWKKFDYRDLNYFIKSNYKGVGPDKAIFINHYSSFIEDYCRKYDEYKINCIKLFSNSIQNEDKFWLRLIFSALHSKLIEYFNEHKIKVTFKVNPGNTKVPLINIMPSDWKIKENQLLIQLQGEDLKFYSHSIDRCFIQEFIDIAGKKLGDKYRLNSLTKRKSKSYYIAKIKIEEFVKKDNSVDIHRLFEIIIKFYLEINQDIIKPYRNFKRISQ